MFAKTPQPLEPLRPTGRGLMSMPEIQRVLDDWANGRPGNREDCEILAAELRRNRDELRERLEGVCELEIAHDV
jgi:hypothetical protein